MLSNSHKYLIICDKKNEETRYTDFLMNSLKVSFNDTGNIFFHMENSEIKRCEKCKAVLHVRVKIK